MDAERITAGAEAEADAHDRVLARAYEAGPYLPSMDADRIAEIEHRWQVADWANSEASIGRQSWDSTLIEAVVQSWGDIPALIVKVQGLQVDTDNLYGEVDRLRDVELRLRAEIEQLYGKVVELYGMQATDGR